MDRLEPTPAEQSLIEAVGRGAIWSPAYYRDWVRRKAASGKETTTYDSGDMGMFGGRISLPGEDDKETDERTENDGGGEDGPPVIRAEFIRDLILGKAPEAEHPDWFGDKGVRLHSARIEGTLDLEALQYDLPIEIENSTFNEPIILTDARLRRASFKGTEVPSISGDGCHIDGHLELHGLETNWVDLFNAKIDKILNLSNAWLNPSEQRFQTPTLNCASAEIRDVLLQECRANGQLTFEQSQIKGRLSCSGATFKNPGGDVLDCNTAEIGASVFLDNGFKAEGRSTFTRAQIGGLLGCSEATLNNRNGIALDCDKVEVGAGVFLRRGFRAEGEVNFTGARISGQLSCSGGTFKNPEGGALDCDGAEIGAGVFLRGRFMAQGEVNFRGARIRGQLACVGGTFNNMGGVALRCNGTEISADVFLRGGFMAQGEVDLAGAQIGGQLACNDGTFNNPAGVALDGQATKIGADVFLRTGFRAAGMVNFVRARIGGSIQCFDGSFSSSRLPALDFEAAEIGVTLFLCDARNLEGTLCLRDTKVKNLADDGTAWPGETQLILDGFQYESFSDSFIPDSRRTIRDGKKRLDWLLLQPKDDLVVNFKSQPWNQLAKVLREEGREVDARFILRKRASWRFWHQPRNFWQWLEWPFSLLWGLLAGHGYAMRRPLILIAVVWAFGWLVFDVAKKTELMLPAPPIVVVDAEYRAEATRTDSEYERFRPWLYSADVFIPFTVLHQESYWIPLDGGHQEIDLSAEYAWLDQSPIWIQPVFDWIERGLENGWVKIWFWIEIVAGWVLTSIVVVGFSGLLRRDE